MPDLHAIYEHMNSLSYKQELAGERAERIGRIVAHEQHAATAMVSEPATRAERRAYAARVRYWQSQVRERGWITTR